MPKQKKLSSSQDKSPRHSARERLIQAGMRLFSQYGLDGVRTRTLATAAKVNQSAIPYYFGGKAGVYRDVLVRVVEDIQAHFAQAGVFSKELDEVGTDAETCAEQLHLLLQKFASLMLSETLQQTHFFIVLREQRSPTENFDLLYQGFIEPMHKRVSALVAGVRGELVTPENIIRAHAIIGQAIVFLVAQPALLRRIQEKQLSENRVKQITQTIATMAVAAARAEGN